FYTLKETTHKQAWYVINGITLYRIVAAPILLILIFTGQFDIFKWLLGISFFTDLIDGFLARKYKVASVLGTRLDSIGDDLTVLVGVIALFVTKMEFIKEQKFVFIVFLLLFLVQTTYALIRYGKITNFHTWLAKTAALLQGVFLLLAFFTDEPNLVLFYAAAIITILELIEEIILVRLLPDWETNVKGIYWVLKKRRKTKINSKVAE
ncbi:MAG TPA: CDP-alcohol phosphatidyltransferase family protein, partial [Chitinophagaceae bacterium]|nr:CDP-alcohol phosphatidyltransferase family protein [Chitinophagaceae bacterium]